MQYINLLSTFAFDIDITLLAVYITVCMQTVNNVLKYKGFHRVLVVM